MGEEREKHVTGVLNRMHFFKRPITPVIPALWEAEVGRLLEPRSLGPAWATWRNPIFKKKKKLAGPGGMHL